MKVFLLFAGFLSIVVSGQGQGRSKGRNHDVFDQFPPQARVPDHVVERLKEKADLKDSWVPVYKTIPKASPWFEIGGVKVFMKDLVPDSSIFTPDAKVLINGKERTPKVFVFRSPNQPNVQVVLNNKREMVTASLQLPNDNEISLTSVNVTTFAEINAEKDIDPSKLSDLELVRPRSHTRTTTIFWH
jgi:hypothetical protein